jgi:transcriptional regulator with XRE-family HTH domain
MGMQPSSSIGTRLRQAREARGMTQTEVAIILGVTRSVISRYESGTNDPPTENVKVMASAYGVSPNYLYGIDELEPKPPYDIQEIFQEPDSGRALIKWHAWKRKFNIPLDDYIKGEEMIIAHYGDLPAATNDDEVAHGPNTPGTGIFADKRKK